MMPTRSEFAKIHIAKKELGLNDEQYRDVLYLKFKKRSSKDLSRRQVTVLLNHFRHNGWKPKKGKGKNGNNMASDPQSRKIRALWISLGKMGAVRNSSEKALRAYVKRMTQVDDLRFANSYQKSMVIESLKSWMNRAEADQHGTG